MKKAFIFLAFICLGISVSKAQVYELYPQDSPLRVSEFQGSKLRVDSYPILKSVGGYNSYNYQDLPSTLLSGLPSFFDPGILLAPMKWDCDPGILLSPKYIKCDPRMLLPFREFEYEKVIPLDELLSPKQFNLLEFPKDHATPLLTIPSSPALIFMLEKGFQRTPPFIRNNDARTTH